MKMTKENPDFERRHYVTMAVILGSSRNKDEIIDQICGLFKADSESFDETRFRTAIENAEKEFLSDDGEPETF